MESADAGCGGRLALNPALTVLAQEGTALEWGGGGDEVSGGDDGTGSPSTSLMSLARRGPCWSGEGEEERWNSGVVASSKPARLPGPLPKQRRKGSGRGRGGEVLLTLIAR